jgi:hypothetical protein
MAPTPAKSPAARATAKAAALPIERSRREVALAFMQVALDTPASSFGI